MTAQELMIQCLDNAPKGLNASQLSIAIYGWVSESNKRKIRGLASELSPSVLSAPDVGYKSQRWATPEDYEHVANSLESQAHKMMERARAVRSAGMQSNTPQLNLAIA